MWIESHQSLRQHPKLTKAARFLGIPRVQLIGHLHCLWWWALDYAPDGDLSAYEPSDIAEAAEWEDDAGKFVEALVTVSRIGDRAGFIECVDNHFLIHDWWDYAGKLIDKREKDAQRKRDERRKDAPKTPARLPEDVQQTSNGHPTDGATTAQVPNQPNLTVPNGTADAGADAPPTASQTLPPDPLTHCLMYLREPKANKNGAIGRLMQRRFGDTYQPDHGRIGKLAKELSGEHATLAQIVWDAPRTSGDPLDYLTKMVHKSPAYVGKNGKEGNEAMADRLDATRVI